MSDNEQAFRVTVPAGATEIPGMQIVYQQPTGPDGRGISFQIAEDRTVSREDLDELLERVAGASARLAARQDLMDNILLLRKNKKLLEAERRAKAETDARIAANTASRSVNRRVMAAPLPTDVNAMKAHDDRIAAITEQIMLAEFRIPYLQAVLRGENPSLESQLPPEPDLLAAE